MKEIFNSKTLIYLFLISIALNISFSLQNYSIYTINMNRGQYELEAMQIKTNDKICPILIPSLFSQILLLPYYKNTSGFKYLDYYGSIKLPIYEDRYFRIELFAYSFLNKYNDFVMGKLIFGQIINDCYFGLSYGNNSNEINEKYFLLNQLYNRNQIKEKIFSFD